MPVIYRLPFLDADEVVAVSTAGGGHAIVAARNAIDVGAYDSVLIDLDVTGDNAANALDMEFYFEKVSKRLQPGTDPKDEAAFTALDFRELAVRNVTMSGTDKIVDNTTFFQIDTEGVEYLRLKKMGNNETTGGRTGTVNAHLRYGRRARLQH